MDYEKMLDKAYKSLPEQGDKTSRFQVPSVMGSVQGNKTIISNFSQICDVVNRKQSHVFKFFLRGLATSGEINQNTAIFIGKFGRNRLQELLDKYLDEYVYCKECKKPETKLVRKDRIAFMKCGVCGARHPIKSLK